MKILSRITVNLISFDDPNLLPSQREGLDEKAYQADAELVIANESRTLKGYSYISVLPG
jgi:hypothetical protein